MVNKWSENVTLCEEYLTIATKINAWWFIWSLKSLNLSDDRLGMAGSLVAGPTMWKNYPRYFFKFNLSKNVCVENRKGGDKHENCCSLCLTCSLIYPLNLEFLTRAWLHQQVLGLSGYIYTAIKHLWLVRVSLNIYTTILQPCSPSPSHLTQATHRC